MTLRDTNPINTQMGRHERTESAQSIDDQGLNKMHTYSAALPHNRSKKQNSSTTTCFVRNPSRWVVLFPDCHSAVVIDHAPPPGYGKIVGTAHNDSCALKIANNFDRERERKRDARHKAACHAAYTFALAVIVFVCSVVSTS